MFFNSVEYLIFLVLVLPVFYLLPHRPRMLFLVFVSYFFYAWWNPRYVLLLLFSTVMDFILARRMQYAPSQAKRKQLLIISVILNLGFLFIFKYWNFANESMRVVAETFGLPWEVSSLVVLLPPGISFYTFQSLSYTIDVYRREDKAQESISKYATYVSFFPQLVAGPIERAKHMISQYEVETHFDYARFCAGLQQVLWGLFQKVIIADRLALYADSVFNNVQQHNATTYLLGTYAFAFQIYCDFAGYSDIALGTAKMLGYDLMKNFNRPYFSQSITEFWRRWHISLSTWLRDYLYISLGGNRGSTFKTYRNLMITMLLGGLWHGASWNFVIWGGLQGVFLSFSRMTLPLRDALNKRLGIPGWMVIGGRTFVTFHLVCLSWIFFRANTFHDAWTMLTGFFMRPWGMPFLDPTTMAYGVMGVTVLLVVHTIEARWGSWSELIRPLPTPVRWAVWYSMLLGVLLLGVEQGSQFIYFQF